MPTKASRGTRFIVVAIVANFIPTLYQIHGRYTAGVVTTKYTKYTKNGPVAGSVPACFGIKNENQIYTKGELATLKAGVKAFEM